MSTTGPAAHTARCRAPHTGYSRRGRPAQSDRGRRYARGRLRARKCQHSRVNRHDGLAPGPAHLKRLPSETDHSYQNRMTRRSTTPEILDTPESIPEEVHKRCYQELTWTHRWTGDIATVLDCLRRDPLPVQ